MVRDKILLIYLFFIALEKEEGRERNMDVREASIGCLPHAPGPGITGDIMRPDWGLTLQPRYVP